jgi:aldehyde dehydrogenase (NAD+)
MYSLPRLPLSKDKILVEWVSLETYSEYTRAMDFKALVEKSRSYFASQRTLPYEFRIEKLRSLERALKKNETQILAALKSDLGKPVEEAYPAEVGLVYADLSHVMKGLKGWMKPQSASASLLSLPARAQKYAEPLGTALLIAPWNYPFQLAVMPLVGAIAAGCNAIVKPSEMAPATAKIIESVLLEAFGNDGFVTVVQGGVSETTALLTEKFDIVFFTGSTKVGQIVMEAAAKHLTPCILELGGKSPAIVDSDTDIEITARRIAWGKMYNCGQTCIAPDYVLVTPDAKNALIENLKKSFDTFFKGNIEQSPDYGRIINAHHFNRLKTLMSGGTVAFGGHMNEATKFMAPTILTDVKLDSPLMQEEIFGPLLPIVEVKSVDDAILFVNSRPKPLALYVFTKNSEVSERVLAKCSSGGAVVNDVLLHISCDMSFGGVGPSGTGGYHGRDSFEAFSHIKSVLKKPFVFDLSVRYPPYKSSTLSFFKRLL